MIAKGGDELEERRLWREFLQSYEDPSCSTRSKLTTGRLQKAEQEPDEGCSRESEREALVGVGGKRTGGGLSGKRR